MGGLDPIFHKFLHYSMLHNFFLYVMLVLIILFLVMLAQKIRVAYPIVVVLGGLLLSFNSKVPAISINPDLIFIIFLPPLLYEAAWSTSWKELWRWRRVISSFAFLIVIVTSLVVAMISSAIIPGFTLALGFLLGGIVSPPDAVSATSVLRYVKVPKALKSIVEGEGLLNDASSLIVFRFALIAVDTGHFVFHQAAISFVLVILMGIVTGVVIGIIYFLIHSRLPTTPNMDTVLTLTAPYVMYITAETFHFSGVLAAVSGGLFLSARRHLFLSPQSRLRGSNVWSTLGFVLNGIVFMLIGLTLPSIIKQLGPGQLSTSIKYSLLISGVLIVTRLLCTLGSSPFTTFISRYITTAQARPGWKGPLVFGWAGMRGVVSLAAALSIPIQQADGSPFPQRSMIIFITFVVIMVTLVGQGLTLPLLIRWLKLEDDTHALSPAEEEKHIRIKLAEHSLALLGREKMELMTKNPGLLQLQKRFENDEDHPGAETEQADYYRISQRVIAEQRSLLHEMNKNSETSETVIRKMEGLLDLEQEKLRIRFGKE